VSKDTCSRALHSSQRHLAGRQEPEVVKILYGRKLPVTKWNSKLGYSLLSFAFSNRTLSSKYLAHLTGRAEYYEKVRRPLPIGRRIQRDPS
jgi:hypothetical protein